MGSIENYIHPESSGLPEVFVQSLVEDNMLPRDVAFRSQWLPYILVDSSEETVYSHSVLKDDILAATGRMPHTEFFDRYLSSKAPTPPCVEISRNYPIRALVATSDNDWHMFHDYRTHSINSDLAHPVVSARNGWHTLVLTALHRTNASLDWVKNCTFDDMYKKNRAGASIINSLAKTVIRDDVLLGIALEAEQTGRALPHDVIKIGKAIFSALQILLADNYPERYGRIYREWEEASYESTQAHVSSLTASGTYDYFSRRNGRVHFTALQLGVLREKYQKEDNLQTFASIVKYQSGS
jgi:hypothetical protein